MLFYWGHFDSRHYPKWNHMTENMCTCAYFIKTKIIGNIWNFISARFHFRAKWNIFNLVSGLSLAPVSMGYTPKRSSMREVIFDRNDISFRVIKLFMWTLPPKWNHLKWNICACEYKGIVLFELLLWHSNYHQEKKALPRRSRMDIYQCFQLRVTTQSCTVLDENS